MSRDSSVGIATCWTAGVSIPSRGKSFLFIASRPALGPTQPPIQLVSGSLSPEVRQPGHEANPSPPLIDVVNNGGAILPLLHTSSWRVLN
jgi:hypothetical protein